MRFFILLITATLFAAPPKSPPPVSIKVATIQPTKIFTKEYYLGSISSVNSSVLALERAGVVDKVYAKDNTFVKKGELILELNSEAIAANLDSATAKLKLATTEKDRLKHLYFSKAISASNYDQAVNNLKVAQANYLLYKASLAQTKLRAPFSGHIGFVKGNEGEFLSAGTPITQINDLNNLEVTFYLPQEQLSLLQDAGQIKVIDKQHSFSVTSINKETFVDPNSRMFKVIAKLKTNKLLPGSFVKVVLQHKVNALLLPESAVGYNVEGAYIYKFKDHKPIKSKVTVGLHYDNSVIINSGLSAGEQVVTVGQFKLYPNAPLIIST